MFIKVVSTYRGRSPCHLLAALLIVHCAESLGEVEVDASRASGASNNNRTDRLLRTDIGVMIELIMMAAIFTNFMD